MWAIILSIVMAILIGLIGDALVGHNMPGGILGSMIAGFVGAWIGSMLFGDFGPVIADFAVVPAIIGTAIFVFLLGLIGKLFRKAA
ncbi:GlsB/YeaQ/YmgE family stress response membrane protein [Paenibacillus sp. Marseille-Q4541]|uniref:GlsB/YeaQ/YmgE family stress response membrane protein n=1 Tax=Paenibacillus sp. Marseille-Q4541 TaxID=2831522 RepID=UPI001BAD0E61|nr:GlsB/YeaQ/YmgE family stress response membrane protein [Paenibacillus sp. Marseille-Q4541]